MRRGLMATGQLKCDECKGIIEHGERYMLEGEEGKDTVAASVPSE